MCSDRENRKKGDENMITTSLEKIEKRVKENTINNEAVINNFREDLKRRSLLKGRKRPRNVTEQKILDSFKRK